jgi:predicted nucleic acid-binding protein
MIFLDTNVVSETMRRTPHPGVASWLEAHLGRLAISSVVIGEIAAGILRIREHERSPLLLLNLLSWRTRLAGRIHPFDERSADIYGKIASESWRTGANISAPDGMIAAIALQHGAALATRNTRHFRFTGLELVDPWRHPA